MTLKSDAKFEEKTNLFFQIWQEFGEFWSKHSNISKIYPLRAKYITFELKQYRGIIFLDTGESCKIWIKTDLWFEKCHKGILQIFTRTLGSVKIGT